MYAVITENDQSQWSDDTGVLYHFPKRYQAILSPGTKVIYYKGKMRDPSFANKRLATEAHYFGKAIIGGVYPDPSSSKGDLFAVVEEYELFSKPIGIKRAGGYWESIPSNRVSNYWRDGVRSIGVDTYQGIVQATGVPHADSEVGPSISQQPSPFDEFESGVEGNKSLRYVTTYERDPRYRRQAIAIHGLRCKACDVDMAERYGDYAAGLIHVHHVTPVSTFDMPKKIDPALDLVTVCPNCHAVIHRKKTSTLNVNDVRLMLNKSI